MKILFTGRQKALSFGVLFFLTIGVCFKSNATDYYSRLTGNWNVNTTWSLTSGGVAVPAGSFPAAGPGAGDNVFIEGAGVTVTFNTTITINSLTVNGGTLRLTSNGTNRTLTVAGNVSILSGTLNLTAFGGDGTLNVGGDFSATGGTLTETGAGNGFIVFNKAGTQVYTSGTTVTNVNFTVNSGSTLQMATPATIVSGTGTSFTVSLGATLGVTSPAGIATAGATGNIQTATRTYSTGASYIYNGSANQAVGTGLTSNTPANLTILNPGNIVTLGANTTLSGTLTITSGTLDASARTMTVGGLTSVNGGTYLASTALQTFNGGLNVAGGTFTGAAGAVTSTNVSLSSGTLIAPSGTFSVSGDWTVTGGTFTPGANTVTFTKATLTQILNSGGSSFNNISHTGAGTLQLTTSALATAGTFTNSNGTFNASGLTNTVTGLTTVSGGNYLASTATQTFNGGLTVSGGVFTASSGDVTTGASTLTVSSGTFSGGLGSVTATDITISSTGTLTAPSGTFNVLGNWSKTGAGSTFTPGGNTVTFTKSSGTQTLASGGSAFSNISHTGAGVLQLTTNALTTGGTFSNSGGNFDANALAHTVGSIATLSAGTYLASSALQTFNGGLTLAGGTYTGSTGGLTVTDLTLNSGTLTVPSGAFNIITSFTNNGGTFTPGASPAIFSGAGAKSISGSSVTVFQNITLNTTGGNAVNVDKDITINGTLAWSANGILVVGASSNITLGSAAVITSPNASRYIQLDETSATNSQLIRVSDNSLGVWKFLFPIGTATGGYLPLNMASATIATAPTLNSTLGVKAIVTNDVTGRLKRTFRMIVTGNANATTFSGAQFNYSLGTDISSGDLLTSYNTFWYQRESTGTWSTLAGTAPGAGFFTGPTVAQPLANDTYYFTIGSSIAYGGNVWYSYQSGNWSNPTSWTTDGSLFPLYTNPTNATPGPADNVVITSGRTISMNVNSIAVTSISITGTLDLLASTGHAFTTISGSGRIKTSAATDNFPTGNATSFADPAVGGTFEINGTGFSLNQVRTFNNMIVNMTGTTDVATVFNTVTLNGDLTVTNGLLRFGDNASTVSRTLTVNKNVAVAAAGGIRTGTANARHKFILYGDFTNNGVCQFTNRTSANTGAEAIDGIVDVNFVSASSNQVVACNGVTRFYRLEINKGTDDTYKVSISASASANFLLYGFAAQDHAFATQLVTNANSLGLIYGTVEIGPNVIIPTLSANGNFNVSTGAQLWINGGAATHTGTSLVAIGKIKLSAGTLDANVNPGITFIDNGTLIVEGGTLNTNSIRNASTGGLTNVGGYVQSGGAVNVNGGTVDANYAVFSLTYTGNVFNMSGGTLTIKNRSAEGTGSIRGAVFINSDAANISVTGGTVVMNSNTAILYRVTSTASFWNATVQGVSSTISILGTTSGTGGGGATVALAAQPLTTLNDFRIETGATLLMNNNNLTVSGNVEIQTGATYTPGTNTTTITGQGVSSVTLGTGATQAFNNLTINKANATDEVNVIAGNATALRTTGTLTVNQGIFNYGSFIVSARGPVTMGSGTTIGKSTSTGELLFDVTTGAQTLTSAGATIHNMEINITGGASQVLTLAGGDLTVLKTLTITNGIFNIDINKLSLSGSSSAISGVSLVTYTKYIRSAGNASDGGLEMYVDANEALVFPITVASKNSYAEATVASFSDDGLIRIVPVDATLATTSGSSTTILSYYWRVSYSNFTTLPVISYRFKYDDSDVAGTENNYVPGKVLEVSPFTRSTDGATNDVQPANNIVVFNGTSINANYAGLGFTLEQASYTAGDPTRFTGTVNTYYSVAGGDWNTAANWSKNQTSGGTAEVPTAGSVAVIQSTGGNGHRMNITTGHITVAGIQYKHDYVGSPIPNSENVPRVQFWNNDGSSNVVGVVTGTGMMSFNSSVNPTVSGDFGDFGQNLDSYFLYFKSGANGPFTLNAIPTPIPNLMIESDTYTINQNITVNADFICQGEAIVIPGQNIRVKGDLLIGFWVGGTFRFTGTAPAVTVTVDGDIDFTRDPLGDLGATRSILVNSTATNVEHTLIVKGNILQGTTGDLTPTNNVAGVIDLYNGSATGSRAALEFQGAGTHSYSRTSAASTPDLYRITNNKGTDQTSSFTINNSVVLNAPTNVAQKAITLTNGLLIVNTAGTYTLSSGGGNFNIPSSAGLQVDAGSTVNMTSASTGLTLSGLLRVNGGSVNLAAGGTFDNFIEYSNTGTATLEVISGDLTVGSQIRRSLTTTTGTLNYTQSNGTVIVGSQSAPNNTRGVFEIVNTGSQFNHSGGSFTIVRGNGSATVPSLLLSPATSSITSGSTITIGNSSTPTGNIGIQSSISLNNLTISGLALSTPVVKLYVAPLTLDGNLSVATGNTLDAQDFDLNVAGNFAINGTYTPGNNTTTFNNGGAAAISGITPTLSFYNFKKTGAGTLTLSKDITINRDMQLSAGIVATSSFAVNLKRHAEVDATITSTSGSGLIFNGTAQQQLTRSASGTGAFGIVTVNNAAGVIIPDGHGYDFSISNNLRLQSGVFDIGGSLLSLGTTALITPLSAFSITNMIQTNSSFTDKGIRKQFPINYTTSFVFPVGQLSYTPVFFDFSTLGNTTGSSGAPTITVRPSNERHPSVIDDNGVGELPSPAAFNDLNNVLQYYWIINADNVAASFKSTMTMQYVQSLVSVVAPYTEADYLSARILSDGNPTIQINKFNTTDVNEILNTISFAFTGVTDAGISGDYFAGVDVAIPDNVPIYTTTSSGNVNAAIYTPAVIGGGAPAGAMVIVQSGHTLTFNVNDVSLYETQINAGGKLIIPTGSIGHRLGSLTGTGDLEIDSNTGSAVLPAAMYDVFFSCAGGGLIYGGTGTYDILGSITTVRKLTLEGAGTKTLANNDITICNDFTLNGGVFNNTNSRLITVQNDVLLNASTFSNLAGRLSVTRDFVQSAGSFDGGTAGGKTIGRDLTITGGSFTPGSGSTNIIRVNGNMTVAGGATIVSGTGGVTGQRFTFGGTTPQLLTGNFTSTRAFNRLEISNSTGLTLAGNTTVNNELLLTSGLITPGANTFLLEATSVSTPFEGKSTSFVNGKLYKVLSNGQSFTFPIGKTTRWRSGEVNSVSQSGSVTWSMEFFIGDPTGVVASAPAPRSNPINNLNSADASILRIGGDGFWRVGDGTAASSGRTAKVGVSWGIESDVSSVLSEREGLTVMNWNGTNWTNNGGTNFQPGGTHTQSRGSFLSINTLSFSENIVIMGSTKVANPLPISLVWFKGEIVGDQGYLYWRTESELNNDRFEIQRSVDGHEFAMIGTVRGQGTTKNTTDYAFEDTALKFGKNYYRLKQYDLDGSIAYSEIIVLDYDGSVELGMFVFPNPTSSDNINVKLDGLSDKEIVIRLFDLTGRIVFKAIVESKDAVNGISINQNSLKQGMYILEAIQGKSRVTQRVILQD